MRYKSWFRASKLAALALAVTVVSCRREKCEEAAPTLEFDRYIFIPASPNDPTATDSLIIRTKFTDCQGDVGLEENENVGFQNLRTYLFERIDGEWLRYYPANLNDTVAFFARVPYSSKVQEGVKAEGFIEQGFGSVRQNSDTIRFETFLIDREGNRSLVVTTRDTVLPN